MLSSMSKIRNESGYRFGNWPFDINRRNRYHPGVWCVQLIIRPPLWKHTSKIVSLFKKKKLTRQYRRQCKNYSSWVFHTVTWIPLSPTWRTENENDTLSQDFYCSHVVSDLYSINQTAYDVLQKAAGTVIRWKCDCFHQQGPWNSWQWASLVPC